MDRTKTVVQTLALMGIMASPVKMTADIIDYRLENIDDSYVDHDPENDTVTHEVKWTNIRDI